MKRRWIGLIAGLTMFILCNSVCTNTVCATGVWSDNFDDGNYDGWTISGWSNLTASYEIIEGNFSAESGMLTSLDDDINVARHDSDTSVGTWIFDLFIPEDEDDNWAVYVHFMSNGTRPAIDFASMVVSFGSWDGGLGLITMELFGYEAAVRSLMAVDAKEGWHHVAISRFSDSRYLVALNRTLVANYTSDSVTSSTYLEFYCNNATGAAIDNLVVDDDPNEIFNQYDSTTTTTTTTTTAPTLFDPVLIGLLGGLGVGVVLIAIVYFRRR